MKLPFTTEQFFSLFRDYNFAVFPAQIIIYLLAIICLVLIRTKTGNAGKFTIAFLGIIWLWMGIIYHWVFFSTINNAAYLFGGLFIIQGILFLNYAFRKNPLIEMNNDKYGFVSFGLILFALLIYPTLGYMLGHHYPYTPTFGLPCPSTIFTFGILLLVKPKAPLFLYIIPLVWSVIGFTASFTLGVYEDLGLLLSAIIFGGMLLMKKSVLPPV